MAADKNKKRLKDRKRRDARLFKATGGGAPSVKPALPEPDLAPPVPPPNIPDIPAVPRVAPGPVTEPVYERTLIDDWWEEFENAAGAGRLRMIQEKLGTMQPDDAWYSAIVPDAIFELEGVLPESEYAAFLEWLHAQRPAIYADGAPWHAMSLVRYYIVEERWDALDRTVLDFAGTMTKVGGPFFNLMTMVRLAGRAEAAQRLIDVTMAPDTDSDLLPDARYELIHWALFPHYQVCMQAGATDEDLAAVGQRAVELGYQDTEQLRNRLREFALCLAGKHPGWTRAELIRSKHAADRSVHLLSASFLRWLCTSRGLEPVVADELRRILLRTIDRMECESVTLFHGLRRDVLEPALARNLDFMSLETIHAPAGAIAMWHFYDFLAESAIVLPSDHRSSTSICRDLWQLLRNSQAQLWSQWRFLERYLPPAGRAVV